MAQIIDRIKFKAAEGAARSPVAAKREAKT
jgi:hypothetical protein